MVWAFSGSPLCGFSAKWHAPPLRKSIRLLPTSTSCSVSSIALTKLDGTAKGGVIIGICDELKIPVRYVGVGEALEDLRPFDPKEFVKALFDQP